MWAFGLSIGAIFPFLLIILGVPGEITLRPLFFAATLTAGLTVAEVNHFLARRVIGSRLRALADGMARVESLLAEATSTGNWAGCEPESCMVKVDSVDAFGDAATSFNSLVSALARSHQVAEGIVRVSRALAAHLELEGLSEGALRELATSTSASAGALATIASGKTSISATLAVGDHSRLVRSGSFKAAASSGRAVLLTTPSELAPFDELFEGRPGEIQFRPFSFDGNTVGVVVLVFTDRSSADAEIILSASLAPLGVAVANALAHGNLQRIASVDQLTGALNRRFGMVRLAEKSHYAAIAGESLGVLMLDLDHFKTVNDTCGHLTGDRVLRNAAHAIHGVLRTEDLMIRFGGEEFLIVLSSVSTHDLGLMAERIRITVAETNLFESDEPVRLTVSTGGYVRGAGQDTSPEEMIAHADKALYLSKTNGRNRSTVG